MSTRLPPDRETSQYAEAVREFQRAYWRNLLQQTKWRVSEAAALAGVDRCNIYRTLHKLGVLNQGRKHGRSRSDGG